MKRGDEDEWDGGGKRRREDMDRDIAQLQICEVAFQIRMCCHCTIIS